MRVPMFCCCFLLSPPWSRLNPPEWLHSWNGAISLWLLCWEWGTRAETRENSQEHCLHASNTVHTLSTLILSESKTSHPARGPSAISTRQGLAGRRNSSLRGPCFINWAVLLTAELLTTFLWGLPVREHFAPCSIKYSYQVKLSEFSLDRSNSHSKLIVFLRRYCAILELKGYNQLFPNALPHRWDK